VEIDFRSSDPRSAYKLLIGSVLPRPIAWVSTQSLDGIDNLAPFSFFNLFGVDPPVLGFAPGFKYPQGRAGGPVPKDTLRNVRDTGEFVVNLVHMGLVAKMNQTSADYPFAVSEFDETGLTATRSTLVKPARVKEALISLECKLLQILELGQNNLVIGQIVGGHFADEIIKDGAVDLDCFEAVGRLGGDFYSSVKDRFELPRAKN
jgi:flavin reductase (DIM6/NTAB) family NADH-FMN oxidoreductase RutF